MKGNLMKETTKYQEANKYDDQQDKKIKYYFI